MNEKIPAKTMKKMCESEIENVTKCGINTTINKNHTERKIKPCVTHRVT